MDNLSKGVQGRPGLGLSHGAAVAQADSSRRQHSTSTSEQAHDMVVFTCSHHFPRDGFLEHVLVSFVSELSNVRPAFAQLGQQLASLYRKVGAERDMLYA